jgi:HEAT repeat protein
MAATAIRIRSAAELIAALESEELGVHLAALGAIAADPERALRYGPADGRDVIAALIDYAARDLTAPHRKIVVEALARFDDPRVALEMRKQFVMRGSLQIREIAARRLAREPAEQVLAFFGPWLHQNRSPAQVRLAAAALAGKPGLGPAEQVRIAVASPGGASDVPRLIADSQEPWLNELAGPFSLTAREILEAQGQPAFELLFPARRRLDEETAEWLMTWGVAIGAPGADELIHEALSGSARPLQLAALRLIPALKDRAAFLPGLTGFLADPDPAVRLAAIRTGADGPDWALVIETESDVAIRVAAIARLAAQAGPAAIPALVALLSDNDWRLRAQATEALKSLGTEAAEAVKPLTADPRDFVRTAAVQVLLAHQEDEWVEEALLS